MGDYDMNGLGLLLYETVSSVVQYQQKTDIWTAYSIPDTSRAVLFFNSVMPEESGFPLGLKTKQDLFMCCVRSYAFSPRTISGQFHE